jgi:hypothetical protein
LNRIGAAQSGDISNTSRTSKLSDGVSITASPGLPLDNHRVDFWIAAGFAHINGPGLVSAQPLNATSANKCSTVWRLFAAKSDILAVVRAPNVGSE